MPVVEFPEFEKYKTQGFKGVFVGGCVERGDGSSFRAKAHAHNEPYIKVFGSIVKDEHGSPKVWKHFGWICVRSAKRLYTRPGQPSNLMWHELCHILTPGHSHDDVWRAKAREYGVYIGKRYAKQRRMGMAKKGIVREIVASDTQAAKEVNVDPIIAVTGDPQAKKMGKAKTGGEWFKNDKTGTLYRVEKVGSGYELKETRKGQVSTESTMKKRAKNEGPTRNELMLAVKEKNIANFRVMNKEELAEILKPGTTPTRIKAIQEGAVKRWKSGWKFNKKTGK